MKASINGQQYLFEDGISVLDACRSAGIGIPTLCHDARLKPIGSCRMCLVEIEGKSRPVTACSTRLTEGMSVSTHTPALENERRMILRMLAQDHPGEGLENLSKKPFYRKALRYGLRESDFNGSVEPHFVDDSHPYIHVDMSKCITCYRCVRICEELQGQFVWQILNRGHETRIVPDSGTTLGQLRRLRGHLPEWSA
jgi:formate dehydrogenase major subunit